MHLVARINRCEWCLDFGAALAARQSVDAAKLRAVHDHATSPLFSPAERAALAYAAEVTQVGARVSDTTFAALRAHFAEREIVELTVAVAAENFYNRLNAPLEVEAQGFCALPGTAARRRSA
jgi:AhpD family alkylhydroperoxidase